MLKTRIIAVLLLKGEVLVQSRDFKHFLPIGKPEIAIEYLNNWGIDEIILLDIEASRIQSRPNFELIERCAYYCQVPLTVGGGIKSVDDIEKLLLSGADKVSLNSSLIKHPEMVTDAADVFGNQCLVASVDVKETHHSLYHVFHDSGKLDSGYEVVDFVQQIEQLGVGEILLNAVHRDGSKLGYDHNLLRKVTKNTRLPVIACGGVGTVDHFFSGQMSGVSALAAANFWHFTELSVRQTKNYLHGLGCPVRIDTFSKQAQHDLVAVLPLNEYAIKEMV